MNDTIVQAVRFARDAHKGQTRIYTGEAYIIHPIRVYNIVATVTDDTSTLAAAVLHDVVEDTSVTSHDIEVLFGSEVAGYVDDVTNVAQPSDGNRARRKELERLHLSDAHPNAKTIKLADILDNVSDIVGHDREFAKVYVEEKRMLLPHLEGGDERLWAMAHDLLTKCTEELQ